MPKYDVFGIGTALVDYFCRTTDGFLEKNGLIKGASNFVSREKLEKIQSRLADSIFARFPGDNARNTCEGVVYLGGKAAYAGRIADDEEGRIFEESLRRHGITSFLEKGPGRTGKIIALITRDGQRTFAVDLGNGKDYSGLPAHGIKNSSFLYLTSITLFTDGAVARSARDAMDVAEGNGIRIAISLESPPLVEEKKERIWKIVSHADVLFTNEEELTALTGSSDEKAARELAERVDIVCLKKGKNGSSIFTKGEEFHIPAFPANVVDTTGAGDFYAAGVLFGLSRGKSLKEAGLIGAGVAQKVVEKFGATLNANDHIET
ncbi:MAG: adenosine kinase [Candidatus Hadarchaeum sp.]|uniref:adenosine kinase n=1 Tax=Candidatus Hadarchaeum sp. TaxID=2883567 RepID=UPI003D144CBD